jgi:hypothetical protein
MIDFNKLTLFEALNLINKDTELLGTIFKYGKNSPLDIVIKCAFLKEYKFDLPEGIPPYDPMDVGPGRCPNDLLILIRKGHFNYYLKNPNINPIKREKLFIDLLETVDAAEAKVVLAIKEQTLTKMFPNITWEVLHKYGYLPEMPKEYSKSVQAEAVSEEPKKPVRRVGRPRKKKVEETTK